MEKTDLSSKVVVDPAQRALELAAKISDVTAGARAGEVAIACIERVMAITRQDNCPQTFKTTVISMFAGAIREMTE